VRAKARIRGAGIPFEFPRSTDLPQRLRDVLDGIYAAYGTGWDEVDGADATQRGLTAEAIELCRILCGLMPREPEPPGLLALMLFCESRAAARRGAAGDYVPLDRQDLARWDPDLREQAERALRHAAGLNAIGPYQIEAAIQSAHCARRLGTQVPGQAMVALYDGLITLRPSIGALVSRACAVAEAEGPGAGLQALDTLGADQVSDYQPYWAARAHLLGRTGELDAARLAFARAAGLSTSTAIRAYLTAASERL
jgi:RNA polymerase sigma-70 factor (ECF subfamily)